MKKLLNFLLIFVICNSCGRDDRRYETKQTDKLTKQFAEKMKIYDLQPIGIGSAERDGKTAEFSVTFVANRVLNKVEARKLVVLCTEEFLSLLNSHPENYYFAKIPADVSMVDIWIIAKPLNQTDQYLFSVANMHGRVIYHYDNELLKVKNIFNSEKESFEEALRIVEAERTLSQVIVSHLKHLI